MFNLDQSIESWCLNVLHSKPSDDERFDELKDHLHCMVEHLQTQGHSEESAFERACSMLGDTELLRQEFAKNRSWKKALCQALAGQMKQRHPGEVRMKQAYTRLSIMNAILWAAAMLATSLVLRGNDGAEKVQMILLVLSVTSVLDLQQLASKNNAESACSEWRWMMRHIKRFRRA